MLTQYMQIKELTTVKNKEPIIISTALIFLLVSRKHIAVTPADITRRDNILAMISSRLYLLYCL